VGSESLLSFNFWASNESGKISHIDKLNASGKLRVMSLQDSVYSIKQLETDNQIW